MKPRRRQFGPRFGVFMLAALVGCSRERAETSPLKAVIEAIPNSLDFGAVLSGSKARLSFDVTNRSLAPVDLRVEVSPSEFTGPASISLPRKESRRLEVTFRPARTGDYRGVLQLRAPDMVTQVLVRGRGVTCPTEAPGPCHHWQLDPPAGECVATRDDEGANCAIPCFQPGHCHSGACEADPIDCDDHDACTADRCEGQSECIHIDIGAECPQPEEACRATACDALLGCGFVNRADGTPCTEASIIGACQAGRCIDPCDDHNPCTRDSHGATAGACVHEDVSAQCPKPENPCLAAVCDPRSGCGAKPVQDGLPCGRVTCTELPICQAGACVLFPGPPAGPCGCDPSPAPPPRLALSHIHGCLVLDDGTVECWGAPGYVGDGSPPDPHSTDYAQCLVDPPGGPCPPRVNIPDARTSPVAVTGLTGIAEISTAEWHTLARTVSGEVYWWGRPAYTPIPVATSPMRVAELSNVTAISAGGLGSAVRSDGSVWTSGDGGNPVTDMFERANIEFAPATAIHNASAVSCSGLIGGPNFALLADTSVRVWGDNFAGGAGLPCTCPNGDPDFIPLEQPAVPLGTNGKPVIGVVEIDTSPGGVTCLRTMYGQVLCATTDNTAFPPFTSNVFAPVPFLSTSCATQISVERYNICARLVDGTIRCAGYNACGPMGTGTRGEPSYVVSDAQGISGVAEVRTNKVMTCVRFTAGGFRCWGFNDRGQLGDGTTTDRWAP